MSSHRISQQARRFRRQVRTRAKILGTAARPRLTVFRSLRYTSAQLVNDATSRTLWTGTTKGLPGKLNKTAAAEKLGERVAQAALEQKISAVVFDRGRYRYHGRVKAVAEGARKGGLKF
ncbi:MAG: 50S ribosomal protein L18 [Patescibacteria group bacterium]|nr:50S ribosomal protein L18 [Patescibacteria group bacterium]